MGLTTLNDIGLKFSLGRLSGQWVCFYNRNQTQNINPSITTNSEILLKSSALNNQSLYVDDSLITSKTTINEGQKLRVDVFNNDAFELEYIKIL